MALAEVKNEFITVLKAGKVSDLIPQNMKVVVVESTQTPMEGFKVWVFFF